MKNVKSIIEKYKILMKSNFINKIVLDDTYIYRNNCLLRNISTKIILYLVKLTKERIHNLRSTKTFRLVMYIYFHIEIEKFIYYQSFGLKDI